MFLYIGFLISGILLFTFSIYRLRKKINFVQHCEHAVGKVVRVEQFDDGDGLLYRAVFTFTTRKGQEVEFRHGTSNSSPNIWPVGATQKFIYDPAHPSSARFLNYDIFKFAMLLLGISITFIVIGAGYFAAGF